ECLIEKKRFPLHFPGAVTAILDWLDSLPAAVLDARPTLCCRYASLKLILGQTTGVKEKLQAAEDSLQGVELDEKARNLVGRIAAARAVAALSQYQVETMVVQSRRALEYLNPDYLSMRATANWTLGFAYIFMQDRISARQPLTEAVALSQASGEIFTTILA